MAKISFLEVNLFNSKALRQVIPKDPTIRQNILLRAAEPADDSFLEALYADTRRGELAIFNWSREQEDAFFKMQFQMQTGAYLMQFPRAVQDIIELEKNPVGRMVVERGEREIKLIDISLLAEYRNRGIGTFLLEKLKSEAAANGKTVFLRVLKTNAAAKRFYDRLGFAVVENADLHFAMRWQNS